MTYTTGDIFDLVRSGDVAALQRLLTADPTAVGRRNAQGISPIMSARYQGQAEALQVLLDAAPALDAFEAAAVGRTARLAEILAANAASANEYSPDGFTPLHLAAFFGQDEAAGLLLTHGANLDAVSRSDMRVTALHSAIAGGHLALSKLLIEHGAASTRASRAAGRPCTRPPRMATATSSTSSSPVAPTLRLPWTTAARPPLSPVAPATPPWRTCWLRADCDIIAARC